MRELPFETMYVEWTVRGMVDFFRTSGFLVYTDTVQEVAEARVPIDRILGVAGREGVHVFAFQFKAPDVRSGHLVWRVASSTSCAQLELMRAPKFRDWIWYALPYFTSHNDHQHALHLCHFVPPATLCETTRFVAWNGEVLSHFPCTSPKDLSTSELPFVVGRHNGEVNLYRRTIEIRSRAHRVCADPMLNVRESWGTLLQRMEHGQFGFKVKKSEDWTPKPDDDHPGPLQGAGSILAINTVRRVVGVISMMLPPCSQTDGADVDDQTLNWLDEARGKKHDSGE